MNTKNLKSQDGYFLCPKCGEYRLQQIKIWDEQGRDHATDEWECGGCETKFIENPEGELFKVKL